MAEEPESAADEAAAELAELGMEEKVDEAATSSAEGAAEGGKSSEGSDAGDNGTPANGDRREQPVATQRLVAKFLMSNAAAGGIIGKQGANITELQNQSAARLQLSRANEFFPGTEDRVLICSGTVDQVLTALHLVLNRVQTELAVGDTASTSQGDVKTNLRLLMPSALCGILIGKGGATIRGFAQDSSASITVSSQEAQVPGVTDRIVRITGTQSQLMRALALILSKLLESPHYARLCNVPVNYSPVPQHLPQWQPYPPPMQGLPLTMRGPPPPGHHPGHPRPNGIGPPPPMHQATSMGGRSEVMIPVPDARIGAVIGKGGEIITQLKTLVGVKIRISDRDNFVPGTRDRKVHISGSPEAVHIASALIHQKVQNAGPPQRSQP